MTKIKQIFDHDKKMDKIIDKKSFNSTISY
jgi:hypothetical protein